MPIYEYHCSKCKATYELQQSFSAESTHTCEECGKSVAKRVLHAPRVVFKGSGWYATDSRKASSAVSDNGGAQAAGGESTSGSEAASKDRGSSPEAAAAS